MAYELTEAQKNAIYLDGKNILVSAAAGSGKTSVLVERIIRLILSGASISNMLVVTFTKAAANEMKERIENSIREKILTIDDSDEIERLQDELNLIPNSNISTFHNFSMDVIKKFYYLIGVDPNLSTMDDTEEEILLNESFDELKDMYFEENDPDFLSFIDKYTDGKSVNTLRTMVLSVYKKILSLDEPFLLLDKSVDNLSFSKKELKRSFVYDEARKYALRKIDKMLVELNELKIEFNKKDQALNTKESLRIEECIKLLASYKYNLNSLNYTYLLKPTDSLPRFNAKTYFPNFSKEEYDIEKKKLDNISDAVKKLIHDLTNDFFYNTYDDMLSDMEDTYNDSVFFSNCIKKLDSIYSVKKKEKNLMSFDDMQRFSYEILKFNEASKYYKDKFEYIFIDEYQDTNGIQEAIINLVKRNYNVFMVGDVKQSIYRFRNADPNIFRKKYNDFTIDRFNSIKIDLNSNFRSKDKVIDFVNKIFTDIMSEYDEKDRLHVGSTVQTEGNSDVKFYIVNKKNNLDSDTDFDDVINGYSKAEREALVTAKIIKEQIKKGYSYKDIRLLLRAVKTNGSIYYNVLSQNGIPVYIDDSDGFFETIEINTILSLLKVIDNEDRDIDLLTIMRSEIFDFSIDELTEIRINGKDEKSYYLAIKKYLETGLDDSLKNKLNNMFYTINKFRNYVKIYPLDELIFKIIIESNFYILIGALPSGKVRQANLRFLVDKAKEYLDTYKGTLYDFISYLEVLKKNKNIKIGQVKTSETSDSVTISTIHVSKGLEFKCVILPGFDNKIQYGSGIPNLEYSNNLGFALDKVNLDLHYRKNTLLENVIKEENRDEEVAEAKRLLYVALTRAKESLFVISSVGDIDTIEDKINSNLRNNTSYLAMAGKTIFKYKDQYLVKVKDSELAQEIKHGRNIDYIVNYLDKESKPYSKELNDKMNFTLNISDSKVKESVSSLNKKDKEIDCTLEFPSHIEKTQFTSAEIGTLIHSALYEIDFSKASLLGMPYISEVLDSMVEREIILPNEKDVINKDILYNFTKSDICKRIINSKEVYKEQSFTFKDEEGKLIQGIIDLFFFEDDGIVLLDYKSTNRTSINDIKEDYKVQIDLYKKALEKATSIKVKEAYLYLTNSGQLISMI